MDALQPERGMLTVDEIDRGALLAQLNEHIAQAVFDITDVNKKATKKRIVQLQIEMHPSESRREFKLTYQVTLKPSTHIERDPTTIFIDKQDGEVIARPWAPTPLFNEEDMEAGAASN